MFKKFFSFYFISIFFLVILIYYFNNFNTELSNNSNFSYNQNYYFSNSGFNWPVPGNYTITSQFGPRRAPTRWCII